MKILFVRHARTPATESGLIQGSADSNDLNAITQKGLEEVKETAKAIAKGIQGIAPEKVFIYTGRQYRCLQTSAAIHNTLKEAGLINDENVVIDERLGGRSYGSLEGLNESEVRKPVYMLSHPKKAISYILADAGFKNSSRIEPKKAYADKVFSMIYEIVMNHEGKDDVVIVSSTSDVFKIMQEDKDIHSMCYFGHEELPYISSKPQPFSKEKIACGEMKVIEAGAPKYIPSSGRYMPVWEDLALRDYYAEFNKNNFSME